MTAFTIPRPLCGQSCPVRCGGGQRNAGDSERLVGTAAMLQKDTTIYNTPNVEAPQEVPVVESARTSERTTLQPGGKHPEGPLASVNSAHQPAAASAPSSSATTDDDLPGMLAVAKGVAEQKWPHTMDAAVWAAEFVKRYPGSEFSEGDMIGWFANAIMAGYDTANARSA